MPTRTADSPFEFVTSLSKLFKEKKFGIAADRFLDRLENGGRLDGTVVSAGLYPFAIGKVPVSKIRPHFEALVSRSMKTRDIYAALGTNLFGYMSMVLDRLPEFREGFVLAAKPRATDPWAPDLHLQMLKQGLAQLSAGPSAPVAAVLAKLSTHLETVIGKRRQLDYFRDHPEAADLLLRAQSLSGRGAVRIPKPPPAGARGDTLLDLVLDYIPAGKALGARALDALEESFGAPLPASARRVLSERGVSPMLPGEWKRGKVSTIAPVGIVQALTRTFEKSFLRSWDLHGIEKLLPGRCHLLTFEPPVSFLYVGRPDSHGEYLVLTAQDHDDCFEVVVDYPGLDLFVATTARVLPMPGYLGAIAEDKTYGAMLRAAIRSSFSKPPARRGKQYVFAIEPKARARITKRS